MSRTLGTIITTLGSAALIATGVGAAAGLALFGTTAGISVAGASLGTLLLASSALTAVGTLVGGGPRAPKPQAAETQQKQSIPTRLRWCGVRRSFGSLMYFDTAPDGSAIDVIAFKDGRANAVVQAYLADDPVTIVDGAVLPGADKRYGTSTVGVGFNLGLPTETAFPAIMAKLPGIWTADHRGDGIFSGYLLKTPVKEKNYLEVYPQGDNFQLSVAAEGELLFDPRNSAHGVDDESTWSYSDNPVLYLLWYLVTQRNISYDRKILPVLSYWIDAANYCDDLVPLKGGGTEKRYRCCVMYDSTAEPAGVINEILATFDGWFCPDALGRLIIYPGRYVTPTVTITPDMIVEYRHQANLEVEDVINELVVSYISDQHLYSEVTCDPWRDEDSISELGMQNSKPFAPQTPSYPQNRRLAKIEMARNNAPDRGTVTTKYEGRIAIGQRFVNLPLIEAGVTLFNGPVEIKTMQKNLQTGGVTFDWVKVQPSGYGWNPATEEGSPAPAEGRVTQLPLETPTITEATAELGDGGTAARIRITVDGYDRDDITWYARWRVTTDTTWNEQEYSDIDPGPTVQLLTNTVPINVSIDVEVAYGVGDGRISSWSDMASVSTSTESLIVRASLVSGGNCTVTGDGDGMFTIAKTGGANGAWDASAISSTGFAGGAIAEIHAPTGGQIIAGLATTPNASDSWEDIPFSLYFENGGTVFAIEEGAFISLGAWANGDIFYVVQSVDGSSISYRKGSTLIRSKPASTTTLYFDSSISELGAVFKARLSQQPG